MIEDSDAFDAFDVFDVRKVSGIGEFVERKHGENGEDRVFLVGVGLDAEGGGKAGSDAESVAKSGKAFLVVRPKTIEVRCDTKLSKLLREKYETVMESRYFGRGGVEIVPSGQLSSEELEDLVRLSYNMTQQMTEE